MAVDRATAGFSVVGDLQFETDRARFLGRGHTLAEPAALRPGVALSGTTGPVLDPVFSLRRSFRIAPGGSAVVGFTLALADSRDAALALADKYHGSSAVARAFELAWAHSQVEHGHRNWSPEDSHLYQRLGSHLLFASPAMRAHAAALTANLRPQAELWRWGISGDRPILLARIAENEELSLARQLLVAHGFLRLKGLEADLVLLDEERGEGPDGLGEQLSLLVRQAGDDLMNRPGGVFVIPSTKLSEEDSILLEASARVVLDGARGLLSGQLDRIEWGRALPEELVASQSPGRWEDEPVSPPPGLQFANGPGGFTADGREYCVLVRCPDAQVGRLNGQPGHAPLPAPLLPPAPWVNVVANPTFGFLVSEAGSGFTWAGNSQSNRLTSWSNDPVADPPSEVIYLRDEATGETWCPTPLPVPSQAPTLVRHGQGYTTFERNTHGIEHELTLFVPLDAPVKLIRLRARNAGPQPRQLTATFYAEWVLGMTRDSSAMHVMTELDPDTGALLARNAFRNEFGGAVAFVDVDRRPRTIAGDRNEFLGRHGSLASPAALTRTDLSGRVGAGMDPCAAVQARFDLEPGTTTDLVFLLGEAEDLDAARRLLRRYRDPDAVSEALRDVKDSWDRTLQAVQVRTPDPGMDLLLNRWLLYQVRACRLWARSAFYQSGGAFGYRDQLQDVCALLHAAPAEARAHILLAASRQFVEGDVQHWWHPPTGRGVRTRISDDLLWLPSATAHYVRATGDLSILDEQVPYLEAAPLGPGREEELALPSVSRCSGPLYEHCRRAIERAYRLGPHGLPLMGSGDWNDGMNRVGKGGKGESVWLAWFLIDTLRRFAEIAEARGDATGAALDRDRAEALREAIEKHAWDGAWYLRAFYDDGTPLGSARGGECQIDSVAQTWAVISGGADADRGRKAMESVHERLVRPGEGIIRLLDPPFDDGPHDPGYIKGYLPGIRENGAQYTHAAVWVAQAAALLGQGSRAHELFRILNPVYHAMDSEGVARYKVEPYVLAGDVYSQPMHLGRGGWSWYTGSAGWLYRVGLESILGLRRTGDVLTMNPCIPPQWPGFEVAYNFGATTYRIIIENSRHLERGVAEAWLDGQHLHEARIELVDDQRAHEMRVVIGPS
jgi:cyclic beta-1,2-glucan synthetase